jgi:hypothetical protein
MVVPSEALGLDLRRGDGGERLHMKTLVTQRPVEALDGAILPGTARIDGACRGLVARQQELDRQGDDCGALSLRRNCGAPCWPKSRSRTARTRIAGIVVVATESKA